MYSVIHINIRTCFLCFFSTLCSLLIFHSLVAIAGASNANFRCALSLACRSIKQRTIGDAYFFAIPIPIYMATNFVQVVNNSKTAWCLSARQWLRPDSSLACIRDPNSKRIHYSIHLQHNYQFVWSATQTIKPIIIRAGGQKNCDPQDANTTKLTFQDGTPVLSDPVSGGRKGILTIYDGPKLPSGTYAVGTGMSLIVCYFRYECRADWYIHDCSSIRLLHCCHQWGRARWSNGQKDHH